MERRRKKRASVGILEKEREPGVDKLGWHGNFITEFRSKSHMWVFEKATV